MAQADLGHKLGLGAVNAEPDHQVGDHLGILLGLPNDLDGPVDVQQDLFQPSGLISKRSSTVCPLIILSP